MRPLPKIAVASLAILVAALLAVVYFSQKSQPPRSTELGRLVTSFMECLPESATPTHRDEIRGILDRFYKKAMTGRVDPEDAAAIEHELRGYVTAGAIPDSLIFGFMSRVGEATRRLE
jgi:hypothetical protein